MQYVFPNGKTVNFKIHMLNNGGRVLPTSNHGFKFSDGSECEGNPELASLFTLKRESAHVMDIVTTTGETMAINTTKMVLNDEQLDYLKVLQEEVEIIILPFPMLVALREMGIREQFPKCLAFNATSDTQRSAPQDKVIDLNNWSW